MRKWQSFIIVNKEKDKPTRWRLTASIDWRWQTVTNEAITFLPSAMSSKHNKTPSEFVSSIQLCVFSNGNNKKFLDNDQHNNDKEKVLNFYLKSKHRPKVILSHSNEWFVRSNNDITLYIYVLVLVIHTSKNITWDNSFSYWCPRIVGMFPMWQQ